MITRRKFTWGVLLGMVVLAVGGCGAQNPYRFNAKVTVHVDTPDGIRSGSSVYEIWANNSYPGTTRRIWGQKGEAVAVDLPNGRTLFSLLKTDAIHGDIASMVLATLDPEFDNTIVESTQKFTGMSRGDPVQVAKENYPLLVTFKDVKDLKSVERVDPDDLAASFGAGYRIKSVTVQVTNQPVTKGIRQRLNWLGEYPEPSLDPDHGPNDWSIAATTHHGDFSKGIR